MAGSDPSGAARRTAVKPQASTVDHCARAANVSHASDGELDHLAERRLMGGPGARAPGRAKGVKPVRRGRASAQREALLKAPTPAVARRMY